MISRLLRILEATLPALLFVHAGCATLQPRTTALEEIHETYRAEFSEMAVPSPSSRPGTAAEKPAFAATLRQIRDFRARFGEDSQPAAHLVVLEGMVYLQTHRFGMARLLRSDVEAAKPGLASGDGRHTRDRLFARTFGHLVDGWELVVRADSGDVPRGGGEDLRAAATGIEHVLTGLDPRRLTRPEADQGAIYLAANAAIFWVWAHQILGDQGLLSRARDLIGCFLSDTERRAAAAGELGDPPPGRLRYLAWYVDLDEWAEDAPSNVRCPGSGRPIARAGVGVTRPRARADGPAMRFRRRPPRPRCPGFSLGTIRTRSSSGPRGSGGCGRR